jgi:protein-S-isoprenylcysteine O-methyltransferase Ste14
VDRYLGLGSFKSVIISVAGWLCLIAGFLLRVWATFHFYRHQMKVISLEAQSALIVSGPYSFSRNPLYLGGNVFIFLGASLVLGSPGALFITVAHLPLVDLFIRREEKQLEQKFGDEWKRYKERVRRWF